VGLSSVTGSNFKENKRRYQGNEYNKDMKLNWMDFNARQYDPQIGRFLSADPIADGDGQQVWSPYAAMGNMPESMIDPNGTIGMNFTDFLGMLENFFIEPNKRSSNPISNSTNTTDGFSNNGKSGSEWTNDQILKDQKEFFNRLTGNSGSGSGGIENNDDKQFVVGELKGWSTQLPGMKQIGEWDCFYTCMAMIDAYYGNNRTPQDFKDINGGEEGVKQADMSCIITSAGYTFKSALDMSEITREMNKGQASIVGELNEDKSGHVTIPVFIQVCGDSKGNMEIRTSVMDPGYGRVMPKTSTFWQENYEHSSPKLIIYRP
jgi:RHS repeat-associated protein